MMESIIRAAEQANAEADGDYRKDGLLYCGKCDTPKQCRVPILGMERIVPCLCKCGKEERDSEEQEAKKTEALRLMRDRRQQGFPDAEMQSWTFDRDDNANPSLSKLARNYADHFPEMLQMGKGLLLYGEVGTGKTFIGACIVNAVIDAGYTAQATNFGRIVNAVNSSYEDRQEVYDELNSYDLLMIDDLAAERDTEYMQEIVFNVIDARARNRKPLIITTNLTGEELNNPGDTRKKRIYSRLYELCLPFEVKGKDRRKLKLQSEYQELRNILGGGKDA